MPRRFFKKFAIKRHELQNNRLLSRVLTPFRNLLHEPRYWGIRRRTVVPALAMGLFVAFIPFPGHPIVATLLALALRINIPVSFIATFISNPLTMGPMYYSAYRLGARLLGVTPTPFEFELSLAWVSEKCWHWETRPEVYPHFGRRVNLRIGVFRTRAQSDGRCSCS